jgi:DMSO/TMAO reductase YedYZ molybdopterin-dependent catalytic subunit
VSSEPGAPIGRRVFLGLLGLGAVGVVFGDAIQTAFSKIANPVVQRDPTGVLGAALPVQGFRFYTVTDGYPSKSRTDYRLTVDGLVDQPYTLTYDELTALPPTMLTKDFQCVTGWRVPNVHWRGVLLSDLLDRAGLHSTGTALRFYSFDGTYTESLTLDQARRNDVIVAYELGGNPLSREHGGPVRLYVAPMYGYKSCKWLERIEVVDHVVPGYWEDEGYDVDAWVGRSNGRDDQPTSTS